MKRLTTCVAVAACLPLTTFAQTERDLDSHEHGAALLNVALDDGQLFIELESPWNNLVGFEHEPETEEQQQLFDAAGELLENPAELFGLDAGNCSITSSTIESGIELEHSDDHDDDHGDEHSDDHDDDHGDEHGDDHDDDHGDEHGDDHDDDHGDEHGDDHADHADEESHAELLASYVFTCSSLSELDSIDVKFLQIWNNFEELDVQLIGPGGQSFQELSPNKFTLDLSDIQ